MNKAKFIFTIFSILLLPGCSLSDHDKNLVRTKGCLEIYESRVLQQSEVYNPQPFDGSLWSSWHQIDVFYDPRYGGCVFADYERTRYVDSDEETKTFIDLLTEDLIYTHSSSDATEDTSYEIFENWEIDN